MNITAGLKKLDEYVNSHTVKEYPHCLVDTKIMREILLALQEPSEDKQIQNKYPAIRVEITNINKRIGELENKFGSKNPKKEILLVVEQLAERLSRLEERNEIAIKILQENFPTQCLKTTGDMLKPSSEKPVTDDKPDWKCPHCGKDEGTWFDRSIDINPDGTESGMYTRCNACGKDVDEPKDDKPSECKCCGNGEAKSQEIMASTVKPSECKPDYKTIYTKGHQEPSIIQIDRKVAYNWLVTMSDRMQTQDMDKHDQEMFIEIRRALKEGK